MRAPVLTFPRTRPSSQGRGYLEASAQTPDAFGMGVARGASAFGGGLVDLAAQYQQRNDKVNKFKYLGDVTQFETATKLQQEELKRQTGAGTTDFPNTATEAFQKSANDFASKITDPELRVDFEYRSKTIQQGLFFDSLQFQYNQQDAFFNAGLDNALQEGRNIVNTDPAQYDRVIKDIAEKIDATALSPPEKIKWMELSIAGLNAASYGAEVKEIYNAGAGEADPDALKELNSDPLYAGVTLEQRAAMTNAAESDARQAANDVAKVTEEAINAKINALNVGLHDGLMDAADIQTARDEGWLSDIDEIEKSEKILEERNKGIATTADFQAILDAGGTGYNRVTMNGENEGFNAWVGEKGLGRIAAMDDDYMNKVLYPAVEKTADIPTDTVGLLQSMSASKDPKAMLWALGVLSHMSGLSRDALVTRTDDVLQRKVDNYSDMVGSATQEQMVEFLRGGNNPDQIRAATALDEKADEYLKSYDTYKKVTNLRWYWRDQGTPDNMPEVQQNLERYFRNIFKLNYRATGDEVKAWNSSVMQAREHWGVSGFGGAGNRFEELPIEIVYKGQGNLQSYEGQIRTGAKLAGSDTFRLIADQTTNDEVNAYKAGRRKELPSYRVMVIHEGGNENEFPARWHGDPTAQVAEEE